MLQNNTTKWTPFLAKILDLYNNTPHSAHGVDTTPNDVIWYHWDVMRIYMVSLRQGWVRNSISAFPTRVCIQSCCCESNFTPISILRYNLVVYMILLTYNWDTMGIYMVLLGLNGDIYVVSLGYNGDVCIISHLYMNIRIKSLKRNHIETRENNRWHITPYTCRSNVVLECFVDIFHLAECR
jgi:hypothetical protein